MAKPGAAAAVEDGIQDPDLGDFRIDFIGDDEEDLEEGAGEEEGSDDSEDDDEAAAGEAGGESEDEDDDEGEEDLSDVKFDPRQQKVLEREIGRKVAKQKQAEREAAELRERLEALEARVPKEERPAVPDIPEKDDPDYQEKLAAYNKAVLAADEFDRKEKEQAEAGRKAEEAKQQEIIEEFNRTISTYAERSTKLGIKPAELEKAGAVVAKQGLHDAVAAYILEEPLGPQITLHLAKNPKLAEELNKLSPMQAAVKISTEIKAAAQKAGRKVDDTPDPSESLKGGGAEEDDGFGPTNTKYTLE